MHNLAQKKMKIQSGGAASRFGAGRGGEGPQRARSDDRAAGRQCPRRARAAGRQGPQRGSADDRAAGRKTRRIWAEAARTRGKNTSDQKEFDRGHTESNNKKRLEIIRLCLMWKMK